MKIEQQQTPINILLADDDVDDRLFFENALMEIPVSTIFSKVCNGEELMHYLLRDTTRLPDVLFLDLSMPRKTGFECLVEIRETEKLLNLPIIMFTTSFTRSIDFEDKLKGTLIKMGADDYIRKPVNPEELKAIIHQSLVKLNEKINSNRNLQYAKKPIIQYS